MARCVRFGALLLYGSSLMLLSGCRTPPVSYFEYETANAYVFDPSGKAVPFQQEKFSGTSPGKSLLKREIGRDGSSRIFMEKTLLCESAPGERLCPAAEEKDFVYLLTEKDSEYLHAVKVHKKTKKIIPVGPKTGKECAGLLFHEGLLGLTYAGDEFSCVFFTPSFREMHRKLIRDFRTENILWQNGTPDGKKWIIRLFFPDKPEIYLLCDVEKGIYRRLSPLPAEAPPCRRVIYSYKAGDGTTISAILTFPPEGTGKPPFPLIVFPHGGPQARSMIAFDARCDFLARRGFLVFQPNYRGSTGQGKTFRMQGWRPEGIRRGLADIAEGTLALIRDGYADGEKTFVFGGSWGAYCALALSALYPDLYKKVTAFFGPSNLPAMLGEFLTDSGAEKGLDLLQYGDAENPADVKKLEAISPLYLAERIRSPILLYHFEDDRVISFSQSKKMAEKMRELGREIRFVSGRGPHGFSTPGEEEKAYCAMVAFFRERMKK